MDKNSFPALACACFLLFACFAPTALCETIIDLAAGDQDLTVQGGSASDQLTVTGCLLAADVNGDGVDDLIVATPYADPAAKSSAGMVYVYFGGTGLSGLKDIAGTNGAAPDLVIKGAVASDLIAQYGALAAGDVNGDSIADLLIGTSAADPQARSTAGAVYVIFGKAALPSVIDLNTASADAHQDVTIYGALASDYLTYEGALALADVNGDGIADILIGAYRADYSGRVDAGAAYVIYGKAGLPAVIDLNTATADAHQDVTICGAGGADYLTNQGSITSGDVNGDGIADILLGTTATDPAGRSSAGTAYVIYGSAGLPSLIDLNTSTGSAHQDVTVYGSASSDQLGSGEALLASDVNGDGIDDILLGASYADPVARSAAGAAYIIYGSAALPTTIDLNTATADAHQDVTIYGSAASDYITRFGNLKVADVNGDGINDILIGSPYADPPSRASAGAAYVIYGSATLPATIDLNTSTADAHQDVTIYGRQGAGQLTIDGAMAAGDVNGDGIADILLGGSYVDANSRGDSGEAYAIYGSATLASLIDLNTATADAHQDITIWGSAASDYLTSDGALATGDVNGDGIDDILLGAGSADPSARSIAGCAYAVYGEKLYDASEVNNYDHALACMARSYGTARTKVAFTSGTGPSLTTVTLTRNDTGVNMADLSKVADVNWTVTTDRTGYAADVTFHYLESEIAGLAEADLKLYRADSLGGTYSEVAGAVFDTSLNTVTASGLTGFSVFILTVPGAPEPVPIPLCFVNALSADSSFRGFFRAARPLR
ncbi:MAG: hypothetical protein AB1921_19795 [Thermodesulfobacteriota bacterium]